MIFSILLLGISQAILQSLELSIIENGQLKKSPLCFPITGIIVWTSHDWLIWI